MPDRARDTQRQKVYNAQSVLIEKDLTSVIGARILHSAPKVKSTGNVTITACQAYVDNIAGRAWFQRRWGTRRFTMLHKVHGQANYGGDGRITLPPWARNEVIILHEMAHSLIPADAAWHGPEFASILLFLVERVLGKDAKAMLLAEFRTRRVRRWSPAVPSPALDRAKAAQYV